MKAEVVCIMYSFYNCFYSLSDLTAVTISYCQGTCMELAVWELFHSISGGWFIQVPRVQNHLILSTGTKTFFFFNLCVFILLLIK